MDNDWNKMLDLLGKQTDSLGMSIDSGILELVTCLRLLGLNTIMSCYGHADRITGGPYVMFATEEARRLEKKYLAIPDRTSSEYKSLQSQARVSNMFERAKLTPYLQDFYARRATEFEDRIVITSFIGEGSRLKCQGAENAYILDKKGRSSLLTRHQGEFDEFTVFLKRWVMSSN